MFVNHYERNVTSCTGEEINFSFLKKTNIIPLVLYCQDSYGIFMESVRLKISQKMMRCVFHFVKGPE
jgi:hypothetical protein